MSSILHEQQTETGMAPLPWWPSLIYFGIPAVGMVLAYYVLMPRFMQWGLTPYAAYLIAFSIPLGVMVAAALIGFYWEGHNLSWSTFKERFRYHRVSGRDWLWLIAVLTIELGIYFGLTQLTLWLIDSGWIVLPSLPQFLDPRAGEAGLSLLDEAAGGLSGNWFIFWLALITLVLNVVGEEFWWRGYILPRQELSFGRHTWWIHGLLWNFFHVFKYWDLINLLPLSLGLSFLVIRRRNNTLGLILHFITNGVGLIPILIGVLS